MPKPDHEKPMGIRYKTLPVNCSPKKDTDDGQHSRLRPVKRSITVEPAIIIYNVAFNASTPLQIQYVNYRIGQDLGFNASAFSDDYLNVTTGNATFGDITQTGSCGGGQTAADAQAAAEVQAAAAGYLTLMTMAAIVPCLLTTLLIGAYSDKRGRKFGLVPPLCGEILRVFISVLVTAFRLPLEVFCVALFAQGIVGGVASFLMTCYSYMADVTSPSNRGFRIFIVELCQGFGQIVAQVAIGEAIANFGYLYPFVVILILQIINLVYIIFILPETLYRMPDAKLLSCDNYIRSVRLYVGEAMRGKRLNLTLGLGIVALCAAANMVNQETITLYLVNKPLCWDSKLVGYYTALALAVKYICALGLLKLLKGRLPEAVLAMGGLVSSAAYDAVIALASRTWVMFIAPFAGFGAQLADPMIRSITSKLVSGNNQGALFASHAWMGMVSAMAGTVLYNAIYGASSTFTGLVFVIAASIYIIPFGMALWLHFRVKRALNDEAKPILISTGSSE